MKLLVFLISILFVFHVNATTLPENSAFAEFLHNLDIVTANFYQTKKIKDIKKTFKASGIVHFEKDKGFIWIQQQPKEFKFISTKDEYCTGNKVQKLEELPYFSHIKELIDNTLDGDKTLLIENFEITYDETSDFSWTIILDPKNTEMKDFINTVEMKGNKKVLSFLKINYTDESTLQFSFSNIKGQLKDEIKCN